MEVLTREQANKVATHISDSVAKEIAVRVAAFDKQDGENSQHLINMGQQFAQVNSVLTKMGINVGANEAQAKANVMDAAKKLVMTCYAGHGYFFSLAGWTKDQHKVRNVMIEKAKELCPVRLDPQNTTSWFNKVFAACLQIPEVKGAQIADVMWSAMPEDQAAIWLPEL